MVRLLIVDDEMHVIEGVKSDLDLAQNEISELYTAYNMRQAQEIFAEHPIDIMLCDIEMPQGSGLELLTWVREHYPETETIFLTAHADFKYAKMAIQLGSLEYLIKPALVNELEAAISKAKQKISKQSELQHVNQLWAQNHPLLVERFWMDLLDQTIPSHEKVIKEAAENRNLIYPETTTFLPVLISVQRWHKELSLREEKILEYALKNSAQEMIIQQVPNGQMIPIDRGKILVILNFETYNDELLEGLVRSSEAYIASCNRYFYCDLCCYLGNDGYMHEILSIVQDLIALDKNNVAFNNKVFSLIGKSVSHEQIILPDMKVWSAMLKKGTKEKVIAGATEFLENLVETEGLDANLLRQFYEDFLQMTYFVLNLKGIQAHQLFCDGLSVTLSHNATRSVTDLLAWIRHTIGKAMDQAEAVEEATSVIESVKQYIAVHLDQSELAREEMAEHVYLHPDYLSRFFKKETGVSISDYLLQERVNLAKQLLSKSDMPIGTIALSVGYSNFSHFSKMFKKVTNINPNDFRQQQNGS
ncbi:DNA-binding response regulator [Paenibacillus pectinilyticus]|uniref:DNA-binding response regulator n=1 Tax=Paenibacillus pectinilyticus TaxID=512399 RepID=A0A1C0ZUZ1_9BACL|nr:response regulator [Paenibacillus pectinilyticus]OCT11858.1 DNA-binding response regulator [Paenibacillus pectinilyticus]